jgi:hypothetical protein
MYAANSACGDVDWANELAEMNKEKSTNAENLRIFFGDIVIAP